MQRRFLSFFVVGAMALGALGLAACGGNGGGSDESYAQEMCSALSNFQEDITAAMGDIDQEASEEEMMEQFASAFRDFADTVSDANPPSDLADAHDQMVSSVEDAVESIESGDMAALDQMQNPVDPEWEERMTEAAQNVEECEGLF